MSGSYICEYKTDGLGPLHIDYEYLYNCQFVEYQYLFCFLLALWIGYLLLTLANTASSYLTPTLGSICIYLKLSHSLAGVTFLSFGNGAPDVFSSFTSILSDSSDSISIGVSALLGASVFVSTVVVGTIAILFPSKIDIIPFFREIGGHFVALAFVAIVITCREINIFLAASFMFVYAVYCSLVMYTSWPTTVNPFLDCESTSELESISMGTDYEQTALWFCEVMTYHNKDPLLPPSASSISAHDHEHSSKSETTCHEFENSIIIEDYFNVRAVSSTRTYSNSSDIHQVEPSLVFTNATIDNDCSQSRERANHNDIISWNTKKYWVSELVSERCSTSSGLLTEALIPSNSAASSGSSYDSISDDRGVDRITACYRDYEQDTSSGMDSSARDLIPRCSSSMQQQAQNPHYKASKGTYQRSLMALYRQQLLVRRRFEKSVWVMRWNELNWYNKFLAVVDFPVVLLRDLTIPTLDPELWFKPYAILHPIACAEFCLLVLDLTSSRIGHMPLTLIVGVAGIGPAVFISLSTNYSFPPRSQPAISTWNFVAFVMCILWTYTLADELITALTAAGVILEIPQAFLGLTVLAWGNSIGNKQRLAQSYLYLN